MVVQVWRTGCSVSQDTLTVSAPDISQDFAKRRNEECRRDVTVDVQLESALSDWSQAVRDDQRHNALGEKINRGGTPAVTIDAALGGGMSEGGEAGVFQHGCMDNEKLRRMRLRAEHATVLQNDISGEHVNQRAREDPPHLVSLLVALGSISRTRVIHPAMPKMWQTVGAGQSGTSWYLSFFQNCCDGKKAIHWISKYSRVLHQAATKSHSQHHQCDAFFHVACLVRLRRSIYLVGKLLIPHTFSWSFCIPDTV